MFSKPLFKQSVKANGWMWLIITLAECFMLSCVMVISGGGNIGQVKNAVEDTIVEQEIDASLEKRALSYYEYASDGLSTFDTYYIAQYPSDLTETKAYQVSFDVWAFSKPTQNSGESNEDYQARVDTWNSEMPATNSTAKQVYALYFTNWSKLMPVQSDYSSLSDYTTAYQSWYQSKPTPAATSAVSAFATSTSKLKDSTLKIAEDAGYEDDSDSSNEILGSVMYALKPSDDFNDIYANHDETVPDSYDVTSLISHISSGDSDTYITSDERNAYREKRAQNSSSIFLADNFTKESVVQALLDALGKYGVSEEKYETFGYNYDGIKETAASTIVSYQARYDYELSEINKKYSNGEYGSVSEYQEAILTMKASLEEDLTQSLLTSLPSEVSSAIEEVGQMDLYSLIVGSIFFKIAGLLLPIIYTIMASNNLIATQVDSGSMAYVLSSGTKRESVSFTQGCYLALSLLGMFVCTMITSFICFASVGTIDTGLTYGKLALINAGAFLVLFAISGINFFSSSLFNRTKNSMALGGGISIFFLVATILGLFGSPVIPSVVRFDALNYFNYVSIISLFDVISIVDGTTDFIWKFAILLAIGLVGYISGSICFKKKDLPL
ncbi:MAG: ABC transporter permease [Bacilli bacterium]|jgi:ABC-2 type transport system permease protein|nr:ABC transporter permease [Bacilli bacterium]